MEHMVFFFAELGLMQYSMIMYCPSMVAASAVYAARCTLRKSPLWTETLKHHTGFSEQQLLYGILPQECYFIVGFIINSSCRCLMNKAFAVCSAEMLLKFL